MKILSDSRFQRMVESAVTATIEQRDEAAEKEARLAEIYEVGIDTAVEELTRATESIIDGLNQYMQTNFGWHPMHSDSVGTQDLPASDKDIRERMVRRCRWEVMNSPLGKQSVQIVSEFCIGRTGGIPKVEAETTSDTEAQQQFIDAFWNHPLNKKTFASAAAQLRISNKLMYDGEVFAILFPDNYKQPRDWQVRLVDCLDILDPVVTLPEDDAQEMAYWRKINKAEQSLTTRTVVRHGTGIPIEKLVQSTLCFEAAQDRKMQAHQFARKVQSVVDRDMGVMLQVMANSDILEHRGWPGISTAAGWMEKHRTVVKDAMQLLRALTKISAVKTYKDTTRAKIQNQFRSALASTYGNLKQRSLTGSTLVKSSNLDYQQLNTPTGGIQISDLMQTNTAKMVASGSGVMLNYLTGDPGVGKYATARAMELPSIKKMRAHQGLLDTLYGGVLNFMLRMMYGDRAGVCRMEYPPMTERDVAEVSDAIIKASQINPMTLEGGILPVEDYEGKPGARTRMENLLDEHKSL